MLEHLRRRIIDILADTPRVGLATIGPADLQASVLRCTSRDTRLYVLVPRASDQLFNLETNPNVVLLAERWEMRGNARVVPSTERAAVSALADAPEAPWSELVEVTPTRMQIRLEGETPETIDID